MILCDVNVPGIRPHKEGADRHDEYRAWLEDALNGDQVFGVSDLVLSSVLRIVTHPRIFDPPSTWERASEFADAVRAAPNAVPIAPGPRHWQIFTELASKSGARDNLVPDAYLAALAIESGSEWITADRGFARYPGLRFRTP